MDRGLESLRVRGGRNGNRQGANRVPIPFQACENKRNNHRRCSAAKSCAPLFAKTKDWNGMGTRFAPCRFPLRPPRTRNDSRSRSHEQIASVTATQRVVAFTLRSIVEPRPILKSFPVNRRRRDCSGSDAFGGHNIGNISCPLYGKPRLLDSGCHYRRGERRSPAPGSSSAPGTLIPWFGSIDHLKVQEDQKWPDHKRN